jgi:hypothetical protein
MGRSAGPWWTGLDPQILLKSGRVGSSILPLTTTLTCADVRLLIVKVLPVTLVISFLGHLLQADGRTSRA